MITFDNVTKRYPGSHEATSNVSFTIEQGEMVYVTGHSGAGKSTLLKLIAAIERPTSGTVLINNQNVSKLKESTLPYIRRKFGLIFQDHKLLYDRNCYHNVALPLAINGITGAEVGKRIRAALDKVGLLDKEKAMPITLSGGEQQRLAIARAVVSRPSILIADEPTGNLDRNYATDILALFNAFQQVGVTVIIATHDALGNANRQNKILHLDHGRLVNIESTT
jgi:cell division transport system ATP-binding protein